MTIAPRTSEPSARPARRTTSPYQAGKSIDWQRVTGHELLRSVATPTRDGRGEAMTFVTAFRTRRGRERLRRYREARRASRSRLRGSRAAHDVPTHTSDQISAKIPSPREGSQYATQRSAPGEGAGARPRVELPSYFVRSCGAAVRQPPDERDPALDDPGCRPGSPEGLDSDRFIAAISRTQVIRQPSSSRGLEPLWSPVGCNRGNRWRIAGARNPRKQPRTVATSCHQFHETLRYARAAPRRMIAVPSARGESVWAGRLCDGPRAQRERRELRLPR